MSSSDTTKRALKAPPQRAPLTPRTAGNNGPPAKLSAPRLLGSTSRAAVVSPRLKSFDETRARDVAQTLVTPQTTMKRPKTGNAILPEGLNIGGGSVNSALPARPRVSRPKTAVSDVASRSPPRARSSGLSDVGNAAVNDSISSRFFHASDVQRQEPATKRPTPKRALTFFYADGKEDTRGVSPRPPSPVLSNTSEKRSSAPWLRPDTRPTTSKASPTLSPSLVATTPSPFFPSTASPHSQLRSPSPSKENIHLSYRKGASQIFGMRPTPPAPGSSTKTSIRGTEVDKGRQSNGSAHQKSPSLSSLDSGFSGGSRRRSATAIGTTAGTSPLTHETKRFSNALETSLAAESPSVGTSFRPSSGIGSPTPATLSPTKHAFDVAAEARRERKVLDLEISNSSLLAINSSLEREVRRQKAELKRFRRLSRAGRFSTAQNDISRRISGESGGSAEDYEEDEADDLFGVASGITEDFEDSSDSEGDDLPSSGHPPSAPRAERDRNRLAKDEKRLRVDLQRHKELLVQSQSMNQSLKRCMLATEDMIREGRKALEYAVRVTDVRLGGRILTGHEDDDTVEDEDDIMGGSDGDMERAQDLLDVWGGVGRPAFEGSEGSGDRDSGIEVDKASGEHTLLARTSASTEDSGRPPE